ncbi:MULTISPECIES: hypothetical protein [unclassified Streptomyces]|uniref:hypothetical protein n=1 Tax=unclassified Streptomyces TaxID=2593676 RepID=UPI003D8A74C0
MRIVLFGATGLVGTRVTAVSRSGQAPLPAVTATVADASDPSAHFHAVNRSLRHGACEVRTGAGRPTARRQELCDQAGFPEACAHRGAPERHRTVAALGRTRNSPAAEVAPADGSGRIRAEGHTVASPDERDQGMHVRVRMPAGH